MSAITITRTLRFDRRAKRVLAREVPPSRVPAVLPGRVPRVSRLMALALRIEKLVQSGAVRDYAEVARLGHVSRARVAQILNLLNLAPDIIEDVLHLPLVERGRDPISEHDLRPIAAEMDWGRQRRMWKLRRP